MKIQYIIPILLNAGYCTVNAQTNSVNAEDIVFQKKMAGGDFFTLTYSQSSFPVTNIYVQNADGSNRHMVDTFGPHSLFQTNSSGQLTSSGIPYIGYNYRAVGLISESNSTPTPFWTNQGGWSSLELGVHVGFDLYDAAVTGDNVILCYHEYVDLFVEKVSKKTEGTNAAAGIRQILYSDNPARGYAITNAIIVLTNGLPFQIIATGNLPTNNVVWKLEGEKWVRETSINPALNR